MAGDANTPRKATAKLLKQELQALARTCGIAVKATRAYKRPGRPDGLRQADVAIASGMTQSQVSSFENGSFIPTNPILNAALRESGFDLVRPGGRALRELFLYLRDYAREIAELEDEKP